MTLHKVEANAAALHYAQSAGAESKRLPVVLIHAFPVDARMWEAQLAELGTRYRVIIPELRGFGTSAARDAITTESLAADVHALLAAIGALPAVIGGLSLGGYVAMAFAKKFPKELIALLLCDTRAEAEPPAGREKRDKLIALLKSDGREAVVEQLIGNLVATQTPEHRPELMAKLRQMMMDCPPQTLHHAMIALRDRPDQLETLAKVTAPTLILVGEADVPTPLEAAEVMHRQIPHSRLEIIRGAGHLSAMEQPAQVNRAIDRFLRDLGGRSQQSAMG